MTAYDRMKALCHHHRIFKAEIFRTSPTNLFRPGEMNTLGYYPTHSLLDELDRKIGVDTRGGLRYDCYCAGFAAPHNYVGTRIRLHEEYIRPDKYCVGRDNNFFWLGREG